MYYNFLMFRLTPFSRLPTALGSLSVVRSAAAAPRLTQMRFGSGRPEKEEFEKRAIELLNGFEKIDPAKLTLDAHFSKDLGLDSLDAVEVLMAIEDEFLIEIPDNEADNMHSLKDAINYVYERWTPQHNW